ncbi:Aerobic-type carbon monoxide dehydrogenase, small subunit, CoxS/CutS family [Anaerovirgula multivorans]|uniref:Aerobic-type carbon monoxide dehydrogenase, small subunit, CoxS/CutS family n=1 Tax=Anaerovirgula multivorans TaxID=312168 RepID=A0A239IU81_9FIRM|nr:(2Fe-2S)-binding protein [Anaerovirgula multivorans]SNS96788.1 Aerobic-type carbon monoxide dehydrogenase, small subunit, CoxS/CutS family [Anaerovirgula multivorans]
MLIIEGKKVIELYVNGKKRNVVVRPADTLLYTLREQLGLTGAKPGCENGDCGSCTVIIDGWPIKSCIMLSVDAIGRNIITIEGLKDAPIQKAFVENWGFQCGYCTPGFLMVCHALANMHPNAEEHVIEKWLESNICRCTSYEEIQAAVHAILKPLS